VFNSNASVFSSNGFMPHGMCYLWRPDVLTLHVVSDTLITLAYFSIPFTLVYFVRKRKDLEFNWMFVCFAIFIVACGTTHLMEIWTIWEPRYWLSGAIKAITALASVPTAILLARLIPAALRLPSPASLRAANECLEREVHQRKRAEDEVRRANVELEARVADRTAALETVNRALQQQVQQREQAERTLRSNQRLIQTVLDNSAPVIYVKDLEFRYLLINRRFEEIFNISRENILAHTDYDLFSKEAADGFRRMDERALAADHALTEEEIAPHADGPHTYISVKAPLRDDAGQIIGIFGISTDITERKRVDTALRESQQRLQGIVESTDDAIITKTPDGIITSWNPAAERLFGYTAQQAVGQSIQLIIPPERFSEESTILSQIARGELVDHVETTRIRANGTHIDISATMSPLKDGDGRIIGASTIARDVTERKAHERKVQTQLERLNLLQQITRAIGERQDVPSIFQVVIRSLEERLPLDFGCIALYEPANEILVISRVGTRSRELSLETAISEQSQVGIDQNGLARCVRGELVYEPDISASTHPFPMRLAGIGLRALVFVPLSVEDKVFAVIIAARRQVASFTSNDCEFLGQLSEQLALAAHHAQLYAALQQAYDDLRQTQQTVMQQERLRALGQMASGIAHDINNALSPAALYVQSLLQRDNTPSKEARDQLTVVERAIDDVGRTVGRMRMFSRPRERQMTMSAVDLNALVQQVVELTRARWSDMPQERGIVIRLHCDLAPNLPPVQGAESEIRDALTNLVLNAVDAMPGGGTLTIRSSIGPVQHDDARLQRLSLEIVDTGMGMSEAVRSRCLEPFFTTKGERGTGLGLAMVYGMVERHSADLEIESEPGRGTTMRLNFPLSVACARSAPEGGIDQQLRPLRILLVDDDPLILRSLRDILESDGHTVVTADGGQKGIDEFLAASRRGAVFDVVISDLGMPNVDGRTVAATIRSARPTTPVVLLTGWGQRLQAQEDRLQNVDRVLSKPPRLGELRTTLLDLAG